MSNGFGYRPRIRLLDQQLTLDPDIQRQMAAMAVDLSTPGLAPSWRRPDFSLLTPLWDTILTPPNPLTMPMPTPAPSPWAFTPGAGPDTPRAAELSDLAGALWELPFIQTLARRARERASHDLRGLGRTWDSAGTGDRVLMVSVTGAVAGSALAMIMANPTTRDGALGLISGRDIPVPGVDGLSFSVTIPHGDSREYGAAVTLDLMQLVRH